MSPELWSALKPLLVKYFEAGREFERSRVATFAAKGGRHAPKGGVTIGGKQYVGGQFIPGDVLEQATDEERAKVEGGNKSAPVATKEKEEAPGEVPRRGWDGTIDRPRDVDRDRGWHENNVASWDFYDDGGHFPQTVALESGTYDPFPDDADSEPVAVYRWVSYQDGDRYQSDTGEWTQDEDEARRAGEEFAEESNQEPPESEDEPDEDDDEEDEEDEAVDLGDVESPSKRDVTLGADKLAPSDADWSVKDGVAEESDAVVYKLFDSTDDGEAYGGVVACVGMPDDAKVRVVEAGRIAPLFGDDQALNIKGAIRVEVSHPHMKRVSRVMGFDDDGRPFIRNEILELRKEHQGGGAGEVIFAKQVEAASSAGFAYIETHAAGAFGGAMNGYYTWPSFGYDQRLDDPASKGPAFEQARALFPQAATILDIMATPLVELPPEEFAATKTKLEALDAKLKKPAKERTQITGADWWKVNGSDLHNARFDLDPGSRSMAVLAARRKKAKNETPKLAETKSFSARNKSKSATMSGPTSTKTASPRPPGKRKQLSALAPPADPSPVRWVAPSALVADPDRFQFRPAYDDDDGTVRALPEEAFDASQCQPLLAWRDPADGRDYVVDGHHRLAWAERDGATRIPVRFIQARSPEDAKSIGEEENKLGESFSPADVDAFAARPNGSQWQTRGRWYMRTGGKTVRIKNPTAAAKPTPAAVSKPAASPPPPAAPPPGPNPKQAAQAAVGAIQAKLAAGQALSATELSDLPKHLAHLTVAQIQAVKKALGVKGVIHTADKKGHVAKLIAHAQAVTAKATSPPPPPPPPPPPTKTQQKAAARAAGIQAAQSVAAKLKAHQPVSAAELAALPGHLAAMTATDVENVRKLIGTAKEKTKSAQIQGLVRYATRVTSRVPVAPSPPPAAAPAPAVPPAPSAPAPAPPAPAVTPASPPAPAKPSLWSRIWGGAPNPAPSGKVGAPPTPLYTGVDANGHHWVNGKQVAKPPEETHWETGRPQPGSLNGVDFKSAPPKFWEKTKDVDLGEPTPLKKVNRVGVMIQEPDGRIWIVQPTNGFGNRKFTLAGGGVEPGLTDQQNALKEVWEETGLQVEITGHLGDFEDANNGNNGRLYIGKRVGGAPWDAKVEDGSKGGPRIIDQKTGKPAAESEKVSLVTPEKAAELLHRTDDLAQLMTVLPPKVDTPTTGKGSEPLKKLLAGLQPKAKAYVQKQTAAGLKPGVPELHAVQEMRGFNKKPAVVSKKDMDALVAAGGHVELLRGLKAVWGGTGRIASDQLAEEFRSGDHFPGNGCFGSGTYADSTKGGANAAAGYAGGGRAGSAGGGGGSVIRMALPKTARIIKQSELEKLVPKPPDSFTKSGSNLVHNDKDEWLGVQAALAGYDAIEVDGKSQRHGSYGKGYYVILNRGAVVVQKEDASGHVIV